jgi:uncharacterized Ntn-hydrolase superfamily protein
MTWSIVARDKSGAFGVAVASRFFAVGALCPHARASVGAVATQALVNPGLGPAGLDLLDNGYEAAHVIEALVAADPGRDVRQFHVVDASGNAAAYTGAQCVDWCGHVTADGFSVAGNMLAGPRVIEDTANAYVRSADRPFAERLIAALEAGEAAGGDKRGKQAAALLIVTTEVYPSLDLRVDDDVEPIIELRRLFDKSLERYQPFVACLPTRTDPRGIVDRDVIEREIARFAAARKQTTDNRD